MSAGRPPSQTLKANRCAMAAASPIHRGSSVVGWLAKGTTAWPKPGSPEPPQRSWQSVFGRLAGHADVNGAACLRHDAAMRWTRGFHSWERELLELNFINSEYFLRIF